MLRAAGVSPWGERRGLLLGRGLLRQRGALLRLQRLWQACRGRRHGGGNLHPPPSQPCCAGPAG